MADVVKAADRFRHVYAECIALEKTKRGLGAQFHSAVIMLLNENPTVTDGKALAKLFLETLTEVENECVSQLVEAFGEDATVAEHMPQWKQYKSNVKRALETCDRRDIMKTNGIFALNTLLNDVRKAMNEKGGDAGDSGSKGGMPKEYGSLPANVRKTLDNAIKGLSKLSDEQAERIVKNFEGAAWSEANGRTGTKRGKVAAAAGSSGGAQGKVAANA